ncbi:MAG: DUF357 domain-containing protein [Thermoplasmata archaeon]|nr:DUF357 domain-containing protein [Thermoplasmata archaeon]RLF26584.1 MAG: DUF357 domain-containing protein [Thermoplasmata archaeon]HHH79684.1 DUF357 domain-containing protein [Thermoplasmatales archaeon]
MLTEKQRVEKDLQMFEENIKTFTPENNKENKVVELAQQYYRDAKYYLEKKDLFTAFGCINYAHGLLDALIKTK